MSIQTAGKKLSRLLRLPAALLFAAALCAQSPGVIAVAPPGPGQVTTWIRGVAGVNQDIDRTQCTLTVNRSADTFTSNFHLNCIVGIGSLARSVANYDVSVPGAGIILSFGRGANRITILLSRGNENQGVPDQWQMTVNDPAHGGDHKQGNF